MSILHSKDRGYITLDAFNQFTVDSEAFPRLLAASNDPLLQFLAQPLATYGAALTQNIVSANKFWVKLRLTETLHDGANNAPIRH